jgi:hypothetical protein
MALAIAAFSASHNFDADMGGLLFHRCDLVHSDRRVDYLRGIFPGIDAKITESHRTFESAVAVWRVLRDEGIRPNSLNLFSFGAHARRSALVFGKVFANEAKVGVIGWSPPEYKSEPWWRSSERSRELLDETVGYLYEFLLNSGRPSNSPDA